MIRTLTYVGPKAEETAYFDRTGVIWTPGKSAAVLDEFTANEMLDYPDQWKETRDVIALTLASTGLQAGGAALTAEQRAAVQRGIGVSMALSASGRSSVRRLMIWGDSVAAQNAPQAGGTYYLGGAFVPQAVYMAGNNLDFVATGGNSGQRTDQIVSTYAAQVAANTPDWVIVCAGTNDLIQSYGASAALNGVANMARLVEAGGAVPIMMTICAGESFSNSPALLAEWLAFNSGLRSMCAATGWPLFDAATAYADPSSPTYAPLAGYTDGGVHPRNRGATALADVLYLVLQGVSRRQLAASSDSASDVCTNVLLTGTDGTLQSGATGQAPTGAILQAGGAGWAAVSSVKNRVDGGAGKWWEVVETHAEGVTSGLTMILPARSLASAGVVVGDVIRFMIDLEADAGHSSLLCLQAGLRFNGGAVQWYYSFQAESANGLLRPGPMKQQARVEAVIPSGTTSISLYGFARVYGGGAGGFTVRVGNPTCRKVS